MSDCDHQPINARRAPIAELPNSCPIRAIGDKKVFAEFGVDFFPLAWDPIILSGSQGVSVG